MPKWNDYNPLVNCFVAAVCGIVLDVWIAPSMVFWAGIAVVLLVVRVRNRKRTGADLSSSLPGPPGLSVPLGGMIVFGLVTAVFACRHAEFESWWNSRQRIVFELDTEKRSFLDGWVCSMPETCLVRDAFNVGGNERIRTSFDLRTDRVRLGNTWRRFRGKVRVHVQGEMATLGIGDYVRLWGSVVRVAETSNPGEFDRGFQLKARKICASCRVDSIDGAQILRPCERWYAFRLLQNVRNGLLDDFKREYSRESLAAAKAMVLGLRGDLDDDRLDLFRETGVAHILAISGMHTAIVVSILYVLLRMLSIPRKPLCALVILFVLCYALLTGCQPPVVRAAILVCIVFAGMLFRLPVSPVNTLSAAGLIILALNPILLFDTGTQLSFLAAGTFVWFVREPTPYETSEQPKTRQREARGRTFGETLEYPNIALTQSPPGKWRVFLWFVRFLWKSIQMNLVIWCVLLPVVLKATNLVTPVAIVVNPLIWPVLYCSLFSSFTLGLCVGPLAVFRPFIGSLGDQCYTLLFRWTEIAHRCPGGYLRLPAPDDWWIVGLCVPLGLWTLYPGLRPTKRVMTGLLLAWLAVEGSVFLVRTGEPSRSGRLEVREFDVGHGGAALVAFPDGRTALYDCGSFSMPEKAGMVTARALLQRGRFHLDLLVLSHPDYDHYSGVEFLLKWITIGAVAVPPDMFDKKDVNLVKLEGLLRDRGIPVRTATRGETLASFGFPEMSVLHPGSQVRHGKRNASNARSLVVLLEYAGRKILFTGDLDAESPEFLRDAPVKLDVLFAPHHGGRSINIGGLVNWGRPAIVLVSEGSMQSNWRLDTNPINTCPNVLCTFDYGALCVEITRRRDKSGAPGRMAVRAWRQSNTVREAAP